MSDAVVPARSTTRVGHTRHRRSSDWLRNQLPMGMVEDDFLHRFLGIFQEMGDTYLHHIDNLEFAFDPAVAPLPMVRLLGAFIGVDQLDPSLPEVTQRRVVQGAIRNLSWRGTEKGVRELLELITQAPVEIVDSGGVYLEGEAPHAPPHIVMRVQQLGLVEEPDLIELVSDGVPASVTFELFVGERRIWPIGAPRPAARGTDAGIQEAS
jgi:phage tail-like protein